MASLLVASNAQDGGVQSNVGNNRCRADSENGIIGHMPGQNQRSVRRMTGSRIQNHLPSKQHPYSCNSFNMDAQSQHSVNVVDCGGHRGEDTNSVCMASENGGGAGDGSGTGSRNGGARGTGNAIMRVRQYMLHHVKFVEELGEGAFGKVYKGELTQPNGEKIFVAVKALKENASAKTQADFRREIELISDLKHDNIVCILGVVLKEEPLCMLFEYMAQGDLHEFLIANAPTDVNTGCTQTMSSTASTTSTSLSQLQFLHISMQICDGMEYLASHHYVHRDLAARNCLVGDQLTVKISDFGLSRDIYSSDYYRVQSKSLLPVRWMPSESILYGKFTTESDVWSFGVVLWEIYSYGLQVNWTKWSACMRLLLIFFIFSLFSRTTDTAIKKSSIWCEHVNYYLVQRPVRVPCTR